MTSLNEHENEFTMGLDEDVQRGLDQIDDELMDGLENDARFQSGVPHDRQIDDLDFIQMAGLTRPGTMREAPQSASAVADSSDPYDSGVISFHEKGVDDVDSEMAPGVLDDLAADAEDIPLRSALQSSIADLEQIIAELSQEQNGEQDRDIQGVYSLEHEAGASRQDDCPYEDARPEQEAVQDEAAPLADDPAPESENLSAIAGDWEADPPPIATEISTDDQTDGVDLLADLDWIAEEYQARRETERQLETAVALDGAPQTKSDADFGLWSEDETRSQATDETPAPLEGQAVPDAALAMAAELAAALSSTPGAAPASAAVAPPIAEGGAALERDDEMDTELSQERDASVYRRPRTHTRRRRPRLATRRRRRLLRWAVGLATVALISAALMGLYRHLSFSIETPERQFSLANAQATKGKFGQASRLFEQVAARNPEHALRADAEFQAAFFLQLSARDDDANAPETNERALALFDQFLAANPDHPKAPRAKVLMGLIQFRQERYREAIDLLRDPDLRLKDPEAALPALRALARAYALLGDADAAKSAYLQAASMLSNFSPDADFDALGDLYLRMSETAKTGEERRQLQELALVQWNHAIKFPGCDLASRNIITTKREVLRAKMTETTGAPGAAGVVGVAAAPGTAGITAVPSTAVRGITVIDVKPYAPATTIADGPEPASAGEAE